MYRLVFLSGPLKGKRLVVQQDAVVIGRDPDCHIVVPDDEISRKHVAIERTADGVRIRDLGSMNGILLNDRQLREAPLQHGDTFEIGRTRAQFQMTGHSELTHVRRISRVQGLTIAAVVLIILFELTFLVGLSVWHSDVLSTPPRVSPEALPPAPPAEPRREARAPAPAPAAVTAAAPVQAEAHVAREIRQLREDMDGLRGQVEELAKPPPVLVAFEPVEPSNEPESAAADRPAATGPAKDPLTRKAQEMLDEAVLEISRNNLTQADHLLERIEFMAPDFLPAYIERGRLLERRGMLAKAGEQWTEVMNRSKGKPLYEQAAAERIRLSRLEMVQKTAAAGRTAGTGAEAASRLPRRVRITNIDEQRFQASDQFDEMRLIGVGLKQKPGEQNLDSFDIRVVIRFFDQESETNGVMLTRAVVPKEPLRIEGYWSGRDERAVSAAYVIPPGFREQEKQKYGRRRYYYGCLVQVFYREELQDEDARPRNLLEKVATMPAPLHGTKPMKPRKLPPAEPRGSEWANAAPEAATATSGAARVEPPPAPTPPPAEPVPAGMR